MQFIKSILVALLITKMTLLAVNSENHSGKSPMIMVFDTTLEEGTTITLPLNGNVNLHIDWGDGNSEDVTTAGNLSYSYAEEGEYTVEISGELEKFGISINQGNYTYPNTEKLIKLISFGDLGIESLEGAFLKAKNLMEISSSLPESVTDISYLFFMNHNFNLDIGSWDVSNVTNMRATFNNALQFNQDLGGWNVSNVTNMRELFSATRFNQDISSWDVSSVTNMKHMFANRHFNQDISQWDVSKVTDMSHMFFLCKDFNQNLSEWDVSNVTSMNAMFSGFLLDTGMSMSFNGDISTWDVGNVVDMEDMFNRCTSFNQDIGSWDVSNVTSMRTLFNRAESFDQDLSNWDVSNVTNMYFMFSGVDGENLNISNWDVSSVTEMGNMFSNCTNFNDDIGSWDVSNVTSMYGMFRSASSFNQDIGDWDISNVTDMGFMFKNAQSFNQDLSDWDISNVTFIREIFKGVVLNTNFYDKMLIKWSQIEDLHHNMSFDAGGSKYSEIAVNAREYLKNEKHWSITDGGLDPLSSYAIKIPEDYPTIEEGVINSTDGDIILVAPGTYSEDYIHIDKKISLFSHYPIELDSSYIQNTILDNVTLFLTVADVEINGFHLTGDGEVHGVFISNYEIEDDGDITIKNNIFNQFYSGISNNGPTNMNKLDIIDNRFSNCSMGIFTVPDARFLTIDGNRITDCNDGIHMEYVFKADDNRGVDYRSDQKDIISNNLIRDCTTGLHLYNTYVEVVDNIIRSNNRGVDLHDEGSWSTPNKKNIFINNIISFNETGIDRYVSNNPDIDLILSNNTITNNDLAGVTTHNGNVVVTNSILWGNGSNLIGNGEYNYTINYSNIEGGVPTNGNFNNGVGNIDLDPLFVDTNSFYLSENSPSIDGGDPNQLFNDIEDPNNLGFPLYPAMGSLRNDMGGYGGNRSYPEAQGEIVIDSDTVWDSDLIEIYGDIIISSGATLTIEAGTILDFQGPFMIDVKGRLIANGSYEDKIIFSSSSDTGWEGIKFIDNIDPESEIRNSIIKDVNCSEGSVIYIENSTTTKASSISIIDVIVEENDNDGDGGAIFVYGGEVEIVNSLIVGNSAGLDGGGIYLEDSNGFILNTTIAENSCGGDGGGICLKNSNLELLNSIVWGNIASEQPNQIFIDGNSSAKILHSDIEGGFDGLTGDGSGDNYTSIYEDNLSIDPQFDDQFSILETSPCIDKGSMYVCGYVIPEFDIIGNSRVYPETIDMGAYEFTPSSIEDNLPKISKLHQNYPNPFNPTTTINYQIAKEGAVTLSLYNVKGELVKELANWNHKPGFYSIEFDGSNLSSGIYYYSIEGKSFRSVKRMALIR